MRFAPLIFTKTLPAFLAVVAIWPLYRIYEDYRVMLYSVLLHWVLTLLTGHLVAERPFRVHFRAAVLKKGFAFGWPLLINNIILFMVFQGDRLLVGRELGMGELALFSMGITLTLTPTLVSASSEQQFFLPQLSAARDAPDRFQPLAFATLQVSLVAGMLLVLAITLLGGLLVHILLGEKYTPLIGLLPWLAIWQACRTLKVGNTIVALSLAQTSNAMVANGVRLLGFPLAWFVLTQGGDILHIVWIAIGAELCAYGVSSAMVMRRAALSFTPMILPLLGVFSTFALAAAQPVLPPLWGLAALFSAALLSLASMRALHGLMGRKPASPPRSPSHE